MLCCWYYAGYLGNALGMILFLAVTGFFFYSICINCFKFLRYGVLNSFSMFGDLFVCPLHRVNWLDDV